MHVLAYWALRTLMFGAVLGAVALLGWYDGFAALFALVVAWLASYVFLPGLRKKAADQASGWIRRTERGIDADAATEDAEVDDLAADATVEPAGVDTDKRVANKRAAD